MSADPLIVEAPQGGLRGAREPNGVAVFRGVPYAEPPLGPLRWKPPQPLPPWDGVRDATAFGKRCIQHKPYGELEPDSPGMSEDCLFLNIWTPPVRRDAKLPVLFFIHGGEFWAGSGSEPRYNGAKLAARGAVVVTFNHRLGVFGFLSHPELSAESAYGTSGNYGLLDQVAALNWVRANIAAFGGDPDNITVGGESAGSCAVSFMMASPRTKSLFHRAIGQSCAYFLPEAHVMQPLPHAENEARGGAFIAAAGASSLRELRSMPGEALLDTWLKMPSRRMQPCIDGHILPDVAEVFARGEQAPVPLLCGWNGDEYGFLRGVSRFNADSFRKRLAASFGDDGAGALIAAYGDDAGAAAALAGDRAMVWPTWKWAEEHSRTAPTFVYRFDRAPAGSPFGATHASELEYVFGALDSNPRGYDAVDRTLSDHIGDYWINFARSGDPNGQGVSQWPAYAEGHRIQHLDAHIEALPLNEAQLRLLSRFYGVP